MLTALTAAGTPVPPLSAAPQAKTVAHVAPYRGVPWLYINDVPHTPHLYFFPVPVKEHIADFAKAGVFIYSWGWGKVTVFVYRVELQ